MNFQGRLTDSSGAAKADGLYNMQFRIYSVTSGGAALWSETRETTNRIQITNGLFSTQLGETTSLPASLFNATNLFFEITMATPASANCSTASCATWEAAMTPRNKLATSAFSFNSATLNGRSDTDFAASTGSAGYIQNTTTAQTASFNVSGTGRVGGAFTAATTLTATGAFTAASTLTATGAVTANSTALFRNSTNSTSAFRIQNAGGVLTLFTADTTNGRLQVGSATTDATAVSFIFDSSSSVTDPTGINGAQYYSTSQNKMRCFENSTWKDCDSAQRNATAQTANYTAKPGDFVIANATTGSFTITLPAASVAAGKTVSVKKINASNNVTVVPPSGQIDNLTSDIIFTQWYSQDYFSDGTNWYRV